MVSSHTGEGTLFVIGEGLDGHWVLVSGWLSWIR